MDNLEITREKQQKEEYNSEPVFYCKSCLSLAIRSLEENVDYCDDCGGTVINQTDIYSWIRLNKSENIIRIEEN